MAIMRWDPMNEMRTLTRRMERAMEPLFGSFAPSRELMGFEGAMWPAVDVYEDREEVVLRAELPGIEEKDIELRIDDSTMTLQGKRKLMKEEKRENYQRIESSYGSFARSFSLPSTVDKEKIRAEMRHGVLEIHVPKREGQKGKTIPIHG